MKNYSRCWTIFSYPSTVALFYDVLHYMDERREIFNEGYILNFRRR